MNPQLRGAIDLHLVHPLAIASERRSGRRAVFAQDHLHEFRNAGLVGAIQRCGGDYPLLQYDLGPSTPDTGSRWLPALLATLEQIEAVHAEAAESGGLKLILEPDDWADLNQDGPVGIVLALEGIAPIGRHLWLLDLLTRLGVRSVQLTWNERNEAASGVGVDADSSRGLTAFGRECVQRLNELAVIIDVAHLSPEGIDEILELSTQPIMCSHANAKALCDHPRNLSDNHLRAIGDRGGLVGVVCYGEFIDPQQPTLARLLDHVEHVLDVAGSNHVGIGTDFFYYVMNYIGDELSTIIGQSQVYDKSQMLKFPREFATHDEPTADEVASALVVQPREAAS